MDAIAGCRLHERLRDFPTGLIRRDGVLRIARQELTVAELREAEGEIAAVQRKCVRRGGNPAAQIEGLAIVVQRGGGIVLVVLMRIDAQLAHAFIGSRQVALQANIVVAVGGQHLQLMLRFRDDQAAGGGGTGQVANPVIEIEQQGGSQRANVAVALPFLLPRDLGLLGARLRHTTLLNRSLLCLLGQRPLAVGISALHFRSRPFALCAATAARLIRTMGLIRGGQDSRGQGGHQQYRGRQGQPVSAGEFLRAIPAPIAFRQDGPPAAVPAHVVGELLDRRIAPQRLLAQSGERDGVQVAAQMPGSLACNSAGRSRVVLTNRAHHLMSQPAFTRERMFARKQFIEQDSQREDIRGRGNRLSSDLLRAAVFRRENDRGLRPLEGLVRRLLNQLGDAEIEELYRTCSSHQNVARLQIAMHR